MKLVIIKGAGEKAFCCGGDVRGNCYLTEMLKYFASLHTCLWTAFVVLLS